MVTLEFYEIHAAWLVQQVVDWAVQSHHSNSSGNPLPYITRGVQFAMYDYFDDLLLFSDADNYDDLSSDVLDIVLDGLSQEEFAVAAIIDVYGAKEVSAAAHRLYDVWLGERDPIHLDNMVEAHRAAQFDSVFLRPRRYSRNELELARELLQDAFPTGLNVADRMMGAIVNYWDQLVAVSR